MPRSIIKTRLNLHRSATKPEWESVQPKKRNTWQRLAFKTRGLLTPANCISIAGAMLVIYGLSLLKDGYIPASAITLIAIGRLADILDGYVADKTGTKSPLGEVIDASTDKILGVIALAIIWQHQLIPRVILVAIALHTIVNIIIGVIGRFKGAMIHPAQEGKFAVALSWVILLTWSVNQFYQQTHDSQSAIIKYLSVGLSVLFSYFAVAAAVIYFNQLRKVSK